MGAEGTRLLPTPLPSPHTLARTRSLSGNSPASLASAPHLGASTLCSWLLLGPFPQPPCPPLPHKEQSRTL